MDNQQEIELYTNTQQAQKIIADMASLIITLHKSTEMPLDECIDIYYNKVKDKAKEFNNNPELNKALDAFKAFMNVMWSDNNAEKVRTR